MKNICEISPKRVFYYFQKMCSIPHGSGNTGEISNFIVSFANDNSLKVIQDKLNNVIIYKTASAGYENSKPVILQGHIDMVCEKETGCIINMEKNAIDINSDGDYISANGTTLGADDGIAVAIMLAILESDLPSPALECVFTVDEEIGMLGACALDTSLLKGKTMLNMDSEDEGIFTVSCAGGNVTKCILPVKRCACDKGNVKIIVSGLCGGHSGTEINKGSANSNILIGRILLRLSSVVDMKIVSVNGGKKDNAIPVFSEAVVYVSDIEKAFDICEQMNKTLQDEYSVTDTSLSIKAVSYDSDMSFDKETTKKVICMLTSLPNGVQAMSGHLQGLVQTSLNMGIVKTDGESFEISFCVRSSVSSQKQMLVDRISYLTDMLGGKIEISGSYPAWEYKEKSKLRDLMCDVYYEQTGKKAKIEAIHAGVECGLFVDRIDGLDCVSFGPDILNIHTPRERLSISSAQRTYKLVTEVLKRLK